jgi:hypothetical protein
MEKLEPIIIDVQPHELQPDNPVCVVRPPQPVTVRRERPLRPRSPVAQARDLARLGKIVQRPDFWVGLIVENWSKWR